MVLSMGQELVDCLPGNLEESESPMQHRVMWKDIRGIRDAPSGGLSVFFFWIFQTQFHYSGSQQEVDSTLRSRDRKMM